jgi:hypothetical protein
VNSDWGGHYVFAGHPDWRAHCLELASHYLKQGFSGLFLDTLDTPDLYPEDTAAMLQLIRELRTVLDPRFLLANRGFRLLPESAEFVNAYLFESFSTAWQGEGYRALTPEELRATTAQAHALQATNRELYSLDYADTPELIAFAMARARTHGFHPLTSNRLLTRLPVRQENPETGQAGTKSKPAKLR